MRKILPFILAMFLLAANAFAQSQATPGNIEGRVTDSNGAAVPNVSVSATNQNNGFGKTVVTSEDGNFVFVLLPLGTYKVKTAAVQGFAASTYENVKVTVGAKTS